MKSTHNSIKQGLAIAFATIALPLAFAAQSATPTPKKTVAPHLSASNRDAYGQVDVLVSINEYGFVTEAEISNSTNEELNETALEAIKQWTFTPATSDGEAYAAKAIQPFNFNQGSIVYTAKSAPEDRHPIALRKVSPQLADELKSITGEVVLAANIDAEGKVTSVNINSSTHSELESGATRALSEWTFKPAIKSGQAVSSKVVVPFHFEGSEGSAVIARANKIKSNDRNPVAVRQPTPELSKELRTQRGEATLKLTVDEHGFVAAIDVVDSTNENLATAATAAALQWKFKPAIKNGEAVASQVLQPFSFNGGLLMADLPVDKMPSVRSSKSPELPKALTGVQGFVSVRLNLDAQGKVVSASPTKSSHDELVAPTLEAAKDWTFKPAIRNGEKVSSSVIVPFVFNEKS